MTRREPANLPIEREARITAAAIALAACMAVLRPPGQQRH
jgi:hypothetical protein